MILSSSKWRRSTCFTQWAMHGRAPSYINTVVVSHPTEKRISPIMKRIVDWWRYMLQALRRCALQKVNGPTMKVAVKPYQTLPCEECNGIGRINVGLIEAQIRQLCVLISSSKWKWASSVQKLFDGHSSWSWTRARNYKSNVCRLFRSVGKGWCTSDRQ